MNSKKFILTAALFGGLILPVLTSHASTGKAEAGALVAGFRAPSPLKVVAPVDIPRRYQNETIRVSLTVDADGRAHNVQLLAGRDPSLVKRLLPVVTRWQFQPATMNGEPVSAHVVLPLQLVDHPTS
jgi:hypothetical protein